MKEYSPLRSIRNILLFASFATGAYADEQLAEQLELPAKITPWFTGPLVAPSGYTAAPGAFNLEPYLYYTTYTGVYSNHWKVESRPNFYTTTLQVQAKVGIVNGLDFQFYPQAFYNETEGKRDCNVGDMPIALNIQLRRTDFDDPWPAIKLSLRANVPFGKYQHLNPHLKRTDANGAGSWLPGAALIFAKLWNTSGTHFLEARLALNYQVGAPVHVKGFNTYGGARNTRGVVYPGNTFTADAAIQYNFTKQWAFACDLIYGHVNKNRFSGKRGTNRDGTKANMTAPSNEQWSLAPAIEYNFSQTLGLVAGPWFTFAGRNSARFASGVIALNMYF